MCPGAFDVVQADRPYVLDFPRRLLAIRDQAAARPCDQLGRAHQPDHGAASCGRSPAICLIRTSNPIASATRSQPGPCRSCCAHLPADPLLLIPIPDLYGRAVAMVREKLFEPLLEPRPGGGRAWRIRAHAGKSLCDAWYDRSIVGYGIAGWRPLMRHCCRAGVVQASRKSPLRHGFSDSSHFTRRFKTSSASRPGQSWLAALPDMSQLCSYVMAAMQPDMRSSRRWPISPTVWCIRRAPVGHRRW